MDVLTARDAISAAEALHARVAAACPIYGVSLSSPPRIDFDPAATVDQRAAGQAIADAWTALDSAKAAKLARLRTEATADIHRTAPPHKQANAALGVYDAVTSLAIRDAIQAGRAKFATAEAAVNAATTEAQVEAVTYGA